MAKTKWEITGQVLSVEVGQKQDKVKIGKGEGKSTICMDANDSKGLKPGEKVRLTLEIDPSLDFGDEE